MSEININQTDLTITVTPNTSSLTVFAGGYAVAQGNTTEVQFNNGGVIAGANGLTYDQGSQTTTAANLTVTNNTDLGAIGNITITGGNSGEVLTTDGSGGLSFSEIANANFASYAGNVLEAAQPNITSLGTLSNLSVSGNVSANFFIGNGSQLTGLADPSKIQNGNSNVSVAANGNVTIGVSGNANILTATGTGIIVTAANLGNVGNLKITGGNNGQYLQTDGTGNLAWVTGGGSGNGAVGGSNTQVQYNDAGVFGGTAGFTFDKGTNALAVPGSITAVGNVTGNYILGNGSLLTGIVTSANSIVNGNSNVVVDANSNVRISITGQANIVDVGVATVTVTKDLEVTGNFVVTNGNIVKSGTGRYIGNASGLSQIPGANVTGTVANATYATNAGTVTTAAQPNITSVGTLTSLGVSGNITAPNIVANTGIFSGNGSGLSAITAANIIGTVGNANYALNAGNANSAANATHAVTANTVVNASQPNITSVGTLTSLAVTGNISAGNVSATTFTGTLSGAATTAGTVTTNAQPNITSVGTLTSLAVTGNISAGNVSATTFTGTLSGAATTAGTVTTNAQPNITSLGTLTSLVANSANITTANITTINSGLMQNGNSNILINPNGNITMCSAGGNTEITITNTGVNIHGTLNVTGTFTAGLLTFGTLIANTLQVNGNSTLNNCNVTTSLVANTLVANGFALKETIVKLGNNTGAGQGFVAVTIGNNAGHGNFFVGTDQIAIGNSAGKVANLAANNVANFGIAIGSQSRTGVNSISIGAYAGNVSNSDMVNNSIVLNATGAGLVANVANSLTIKPIRSVNSTAGLNALYYDSTTGEIVVYIP